MLRREVIQSAVQVPAPALPNKNVNANYGREVIRSSCQVIAPAITLASLAEKLAGARQLLFDWKDYTATAVQR